jgi:hypothetical protein
MSDTIREYQAHARSTDTFGGSTRRVGTIISWWTARCGTGVRVRL